MGYGSPRWAELVRQIRQDPANDELRYVAADYLLGENDPRGELIVIARRLESDPPPPDYVVAYERFLSLSRGLPRPPGFEQAEMTRGFVEHVTIRQDQLELLPEMCRLEPITRLTMDLAKIAPSHLLFAELREIRELTIDEPSRRILASKNLVSVEHLVISQRELEKRLVTALAESPMRPHRVTVPWGASVADLATLALAPVFGELRILPVDSDAMIEAFPDDGLTKLARLDSTALTWQGFERLGRRLDQLEVLRYRNSNALDLVIPIIRKHATSGRLRDLALLFAGRDLPHVVELLESDACMNLERIELRGIPLPSVIEHALRRIAARGKLREVTVVNRKPTISLPGVHVILVS